jgi:hypothetical protein
VLEKNDPIQLFADLVGMNKTAYFVGHLYFGVIGRPCGGDCFFSPAQYFENFFYRNTETLTTLSLYFSRGFKNITTMIAIDVIYKEARNNCTNSFSL